MLCSLSSFPSGTGLGEDNELPEAAGSKCVVLALPQGVSVPTSTRNQPCPSLEKLKKAVSGTFTTC